MTQIKKILDKQGNEVFLRTSTKAVVDENGYTAESRLQAMQDEINQAQLQVGAVPSDLTPTENSTNWVTSGGLYNELNIGKSNVAFELDDYTSVRAFVGSDDRWLVTNDNYPYYSKFIPIEAGQKYIIRAGSNNAFYCFLKNNTYSNNASVAYAQGSTRTELAANTSVVVTAGLNAKYLNVATITSVDRTPQAIIEYNKQRIHDITEQLNGSVFKKIELNTLLSLGFAPDGQGRWNTAFASKFVPCTGGDKFVFKCSDNNSMLYVFTKEEDFSTVASFDTVQYADGYSGSGNGIRVPKGEYGILTAPSDATYLLFFTTEMPEYLYYVEKDIDNPIMYSGIKQVYEPFFLKIGENTNVIYTIDNFIMAYGTEDNVDYLYFSKDLGKNWVSLENIYGDITHAHYFDDGTLMFCSRTNVYYTKDFVTVNESTVYDYDGSNFTVAQGKTRFYMIPKYTPERTYVNGTEWHLFGDYILGTTTNPRIWYSNDYGRTVHAAFAFGYSQIDGTTYYARHIHSFVYNKYNGYFYVFTGDSSTQCHILKGSYSNNSWNWEHIVTGEKWKLTSPIFDEGNLYAVTDYTETSLKDYKGIVKCPINNISLDNISYIVNIPDSVLSTAALSAYIYDNNGWRLLSTDYLGGMKILIAKNNYDFRWVSNTRKIRLWSFFGANNNGDVYAHISSSSNSSSANDESWCKLNSPTINVTDAMRNSGASDFFNYKINKIY